MSKLVEARKKHLDATLNQITGERNNERKIKNPRKEVVGTRKIILDAYKRTGKRASAYLAMKMANQRIGKEVYTIAMVDGWIDEYEQEQVK